MPASNDSAVEELRAIERALCEAVAADDFSSALALLPLQEAAFRKSVETVEDGRALCLDSNVLLRSCLRMVRTQRQEAINEYSRLFDTSSFLTEDRRLGTWEFSG